MTDNARPDGFDFEPNGTILCFIDGEKWKLRRPKTGEYKQLRLAARERDDELNKLQQEAMAADAADKPTEADDVATLATAERTMAMARSLTDRREELDQQWVADTFTLLADHSLPDDRDDWPVWLWQSDNVGQFLNHWRNVPLARGGS